jgi:beta-glucanase (GH16 family)
MIASLRFSCLLLLGLTGLGHLSAANPPPPITDGGYQLVWADEFNTDGRPDPANWVYEEGFVRNEELQWYQPDNARVANGLLVIEARAENRPNPRHQPGSRSWRTNRPTIAYTSACLTTQGKHTWQYGRFELRARIGIDAGMWPAWWTLGVKGNWPGNGEIDIMEYYRGILLANIACRGSDGKPEWFSTKIPTDSLGGAAWAREFHVWRMDWTENAIALYCDNQLLLEVPVAKLQNRDGSGFNPFQQPHYMLLNLALGGMNGGSIEGTQFPQLFEIDYVRVYQRR